MIDARIARELLANQLNIEAYRLIQRHTDGREIDGGELDENIALIMGNPEIDDKRRAVTEFLLNEPGSISDFLGDIILEECPSCESRLKLIDELFEMSPTDAWITVLTKFKGEDWND